MKKLLKSVHIYRSYRQNKPGGPFFWNTRYVCNFLLSWESSFRKPIFVIATIVSVHNGQCERNISLAESQRLRPSRETPRKIHRTSTCNSCRPYSQFPRGMPAPPAICSACVNLKIILVHILRQIIPGSKGPIFTKFSPYDRYLFVDYWSDRILPIAQGT